MAAYHAKYLTDLARPSVVMAIPYVFAMGDNESHTFTALVYDSANKECGLMPGTVSGVVVRPDGATVPLTGTKGADVETVKLDDGSTAQATACTLTLLQACFAYAGQITIVIRLNNGDSQTAVFIGRGTVTTSLTDTQVDPGTVIEDITQLITDAEQAAEDAEEALAIATHMVRYDETQTMTSSERAIASHNVGAHKIAEVFDPTATYTQGRYVLYLGDLYRLDAASFGPGAFNYSTGGWTYINPTQEPISLAEHAYTDAEKAQARENIGAGSAEDVSDLQMTDLQLGGMISDVGHSLAAEYDWQAGTYAVGDYVMSGDKLYRCTTAIATPETWTPAHWTEVKLSGDLTDLRGAFSETAVSREIEDDADLDITDPHGYVIARFANGHIKTKNFDSEEIDNTEIEILKNRFEYKEATDTEHELYVQDEITLDPDDYTSKSRCTVSADGTSLIVTRSDSPDSSTGQVLADFSENPLDLSMSNIGIDFDIIQGTSGQLDYFEHISEVCLILKSDSSTSNVRYTMAVNSANHLLYAGNYKLTLHLDIQRAGATTPIDLSAVKKVGFLISTVADSSGGTTTYPGTPSVRINRLFAYSFNKRRQVVIGFDGAYVAQMQAGNYLAANGMPGVFFVNKTLVDTSDPSRMTSANLKTLYDAGHMIANYCSGYGYWYNLTLAEKKTAINENAKWLYQKGYGNGARYISVPGGGYDADEASIYSEGYAKVITGRSIAHGSPQPAGFYDSQPYGHTNGPGASNTSRKTAIDSLLRDGGICIFIFHQCNGSYDDVTLDEFKAFADYVKAKRDAGLLEVVTADKLALDYTVSTPVAD